MKENYLYKIYIDTASRQNRSVTLVRIVDNKETPLQKIEGEVDIVSSLQKILAGHNLQPSDISEYIPNLGPGSFTGLKMGVTVANIFNWWFNKKAIKSLPMPEYGMEPNINLKRNS